MKHYPAGVKLFALGFTGKKNHVSHKESQNYRILGGGALHPVLTDCTFF